MNPLAYTLVNSGCRRGILFLHGYLGDRTEFFAVSRQLRRTHTVIYVDLPGHGNNPIMPGDTFESICHTIVELLRNQQTKKWHVVGYSLGGRLALYLAVKWPSLFVRLTLISASPGLENVATRRARFVADKQLGKRIRCVPMRLFLNRWYQQKLFSSFRSHKSFDSVFLQRARNSNQQIAQALLAMSVGAQPSLWNELARLTVPTEIICGVQDVKFYEIALKMQICNPKFRITQVAGCGHVVHLEAANVLQKRLEDGCNRMEKCQSV